MKKAINKQFILSTLICFIPFIVSIYFYNRLPNEVAIHFDNYGNPDNYAPKVIAAFGVPLVSICIHGLDLRMSLRKLIFQMLYKIYQNGELLYFQ